MVKGDSVGYVKGEYRVSPEKFAEYAKKVQKNIRIEDVVIDLNKSTRYKDNPMDVNEFESGGGEFFEKALCGAVRVNTPEFKKDLEKVKGPARTKGVKFHVGFNDSVDLAKKYQPLDENYEPVDPTRPQKDFLRDVREGVFDSLLDLVDSGHDLDIDEKDEDEIKIYTAVDSPLDKLHGTDVFVEIKGKIITIDVTLKKDKKNPKANVMVYGAFPTKRENKDVYTEVVNRVAEKVADIYNEKVGKEYRRAA